MAGHSKWANIKHRKGAQDAKRGKVFTKIIKEISVAVKEGGDDINSNPRLRTAIQNAKGVNMPKENVDRAIKKASGDGGNTYMEVTYEGYAPHGIAVFIECATDNINRTVAEIRSIFNKHGGELGKNGSLEFLFEKKGVFIIAQDQVTIEADLFEMELIDFGLEDLELKDGYFNILCDFDQFGVMQEKLASMNIEITSAETQRIPHETKNLIASEGVKLLSVFEKFEENEDVQQVFHNLNITSEMLAELNQ